MAFHFGPQAFRMPTAENVLWPQHVPQLAQEYISIGIANKKRTVNAEEKTKSDSTYCFLAQFKQPIPIACLFGNNDFMQTQYAKYQHILNHGKPLNMHTSDRYYSEIADVYLEETLYLNCLLHKNHTIRGSLQYLNLSTLYNQTLHSDSLQFEGAIYWNQSLFQIHYEHLFTRQCNDLIQNSKDCTLGAGFHLATVEHWVLTY